MTTRTRCLVESQLTGETETVGQPKSVKVEPSPEDHARAMSPARRTLPEDIPDPGTKAPTHDEVVEALAAIHWPRTLSRPNV